MSLRHQTPDFQVCTSHVQSALRPASLWKPPVEMSFQRGRNIAELASQILEMPAVALTAAAGMGKSTSVPAALASAAQKLVYHVVPSKLLAVDLYDYVSVKVQGLPVELGLEVNELATTAGAKVIVTYSAAMVAALLQGVVTAAQCVLFLDESHESDAYTYTLQQLARDLGFPNVVYASATAGGGDFRATRLDGGCEMKTYEPDEDPSVWDVTQAGRPWSVHKMSGNYIVFFDDFDAFGRVTAEYQRAGVSVYKLKADMSVENFRRTMAIMRARNGPLAVFVADYSFRSGFTFSASRVIDLSTVRNVEVVGGNPVARRRQVVEFEVYQTAARVGRVAGCPAVYYRPKFTPASTRISLEGVEVDAAALLFKALGYSPGIELHDSLLVHAQLPVGLAKALNSFQPLVVQGIPRIELPVLDIDPREGILGDSDSSGSDFADAEGRPVSPSVASCASELEHERENFMSLASLCDAVAGEVDRLTLVRGNFYVMYGQYDAVAARAAFPQGFKSVMRVHGEQPMQLGYMDRPTRMAAVAVLLIEANATTCDTRGLYAALSTVPRELALEVRGNPHAKQWIAGALEKMSDSERAIDQLHAAVMAFMRDDIHLKEMAGWDDEIRKRRDFYHEALSAGLVASGVEDMRLAVCERVEDQSRKLMRYMARHDVPRVQAISSGGAMGMGVERTVQTYHVASRRGEETRREWVFRDKPTNMLTSAAMRFSGTPTEVRVTHRVLPADREHPPGTRVRRVRRTKYLDT